ncbi:hypothetical protein MSG28_001582 [Choristoneura fumiferana]|uniref:Uncharacterized protein n=2 Tax=Choristoneura fumiferana TaxID=7141 RepID=A0ACC0KUL1_CHOFU|nr:hypothetical protein MSG28_001582 [Choristoneura fumiferana]
MLRNILIDYDSATEVSPYEYMRVYIDKCPVDTDDTKLAWIAETFLGIQKHRQILKDIASRLSEELVEEDQDYFMILFHAIIFQIDPKDLSLLYKCIFNTSKTLLSTFSNFLSNNEVLAFISQAAQSYYDTNFITEKIITPLFEWQPYISEMAHSYAEYIKKMESRKTKPPTVPIQPNVLSRKAKDVQPVAGHGSHASLPLTPPNSVQQKSKRMLTKSVIDEKLKKSYEKNKQKAAHLLNDVKNKEFRYAQTKSEGFFKKISSIKNEMEYAAKPVKFERKNVNINVSQPVKETATTIKRVNKRIQQAEQEEVKWLTNAIQCRNTAKIEELQEFDRQERERERLLDIEKKHLMGQISYEEALLAKKKLIDENKKKHEEFLKERETWNEDIEKWRKNQMEKNRKYIEKLSLTELSVLEAKHCLSVKNRENAEKFKQDNQTLLAKAMKAKQEELEYRIKMIKEIKILAAIAKKARVPKIIDLTETSGLGLLCEMSIAELQERMNAMKIGLNEELERKKNMIKEEKTAAKHELEETKNSIQTYMNEKATARKQKKSNSPVNKASSKEIDDLKKVLQEKRKLRMKLSNC